MDRSEDLHAGWLDEIRVCTEEACFLSARDSLERPARSVVGGGVGRGGGGRGVRIFLGDVGAPTRRWGVWHLGSGGAVDGSAADARALDGICGTTGSRRRVRRAGIGGGGACEV